MSRDKKCDARSKSHKVVKARGVNLSQSIAVWNRFLFALIERPMACGATSVDWMSGYLGASGNGDDTCQEVSNHRLQGDSEAIHVDSVDQAQAVLFNPSGVEETRRQIEIF